MRDCKCTHTLQHLSLLWTEVDCDVTCGNLKYIKIHIYIYTYNTYIYVYIIPVEKKETHFSAPSFGSIEFLATVPLSWLSGPTSGKKRRLSSDEVRVAIGVAGFLTEIAGSLEAYSNLFTGFLLHLHTVDTICFSRGTMDQSRYHWLCLS